MELDDDAGEVDTEIGSIRPDALLVLMRFLIPAKRHRGRWRTATVRMVALAHALGMEGVRDQSLTELADEVGCTRSLLSLYSTNIRDLGGLDCRGGKSATARERYSETARGAWLARKDRSGKGQRKKPIASPEQSSSKGAPPPKARMKAKSKPKPSQ